MPFPQILHRPLFGVFTIALFLASATGGASALSLDFSSSSVSFGNIPVGSTQTQYETFTNNYRSSTVTISQASVSGPGFNLNGLSLPISLPPGQSVTFTVTFTPQASGTQTGQITVFSNAWGTPSHSIVLSGTGVSGGQLTTSATTLNFGSVALGSSKALTATLSASGSSVTISSARTTDSEFTLGGLSLPKTISAGQSVSVTLTFTPRASGVASGSISLAGNAGDTLVVESLIGSATGAAQHSVALSWNPSTSSVVGYNIYRSTSSGGPYTKLTAALEPSTNYVDISVQSGQTYYYVNTAVDSHGAESKYSAPVRAVIPTYNNVGAPPAIRPTAATVVYQTEALKAASSGPTFRSLSFAGFPDGVGTILDSTKVGDSVTYTVNIAQSATYDLQIGVKKGPWRSIWQLAINGTNVGPQEDEYDRGEVYQVLDLGNVNITAPGTYSFKFTATGKNPTATDWKMSFDTIKLTPP
ncbi:MAG: choice-of-anchor D domain-containing protein [Terriglobales bacterium]